MRKCPRPPVLQPAPKRVRSGRGTSRHLLMEWNRFRSWPEPAGGRAGCAHRGGPWRGRDHDEPPILGAGGSHANGGPPVGGPSNCVRRRGNGTARTMHATLAVTLAPAGIMRAAARRLGLESDERRMLFLMGSLVAVLFGAYTISKILRDAL